MNWIARLTAVLLGLGAFAACEAAMRVNGSVSVAPGQTSGNATTVNGDVHIGANARVEDVRTVNGDLTLGEGARASAMATVNGAIDIAAKAEVAGDMQTVNGALRLAPGSRVGGMLANVNGAITINGAHLVGQLRTVNGPVTLLDGARIDGGLLVLKPGAFHAGDSSPPPRIVIGRDVTVEGTLKFEREVRLYVSDHVKHLGPVEGATPVSYAGENAPN